MTATCELCNGTDGLNKHHLAPRWSGIHATATLCSQCHAHQTDLQWQMGLHGRDQDHDQIEHTAYALTVGVAGLLLAHAQHAGNKRLASTAERAIRTAVRRAALATQGTAGPRPITNDHRARPKPKTRRRGRSR
jgi:hypothetical protein